MVLLFPSRAVAVALFGFEIHWYGLLYFFGFLIAGYLLPRLQKYRNFDLPRDTWLSLLSWSVVGVIVGGRLGYVCFYEPAYFLAHPLQIFAVWQGGMSFHGGFIGVAVVLWLFSRSHRLPLFVLCDIVVVPVAIGLALGRIGNFVNQELYGTVTTLPWGMGFLGAEGLRHPIQFYEMTTDLLAALLCFLALRSMSSRFSTGRVAAIFLLIYGIARFSIEYVRDQQYALTSLGFVALTRGQLLTVPVIVLGLCLYYFSSETAKKAS